VNVLRRNPGTTGYVVLLLAVSVIVFGVLPAPDPVLAAISTDLANVDWMLPLRLVGSALVVDLPGLVLLVAGVVGCLGWLERRFGAARAFGIFLAVHVGATLVTLLVVVIAVQSGIYPDGVRNDPDYGVSYGAIGCMGAVTLFLPKRVRLPWVAVMMLLSFAASVWYGWLPDFSTLGHVLSAVFGLAISGRLVRIAETRSVSSRSAGDP
jgi:uncharacterized membrane protein YjjB (DUF3815 family)